MRKTNFLLYAFFIISVFGCDSQKGKNSDNKKVIVILPFFNIPKEDINFITTDIINQFGFEVKILKPDTLPSSTFINIKTPRYRADKLLVYLNNYNAKRYDYILGLTDKDISFTKYNSIGLVKEPKSKYQDFGIYGLAFLNDSPCIVSTFRLGVNINKNRAKDRMRKIIIHEIGHNLGLNHCTSQNKKCIMKDAEESIKTIDNLIPQFCEICSNSIFDN